MDKKLTTKDYTYIASMLFGLFFGAGNLIFPVYMGQLAGANVWPAIIGFLITGVGLPLLGIVAMGISHSTGLFDMASRIHPVYSKLFTCLLYLTIGPFFAIPRTATVSFEVGLATNLSDGMASLYLAIYSFLFFAAVLYFSLRPSNILTWVGKILNPIFLLSLGILVVTALLNPMGAVSDIPVASSYGTTSFFQGFLEGYNTMDALASLAFGIVVIKVIRGLGVKNPNTVAADTVKSGFFSMTIMALIYIALAVIGAQSRGIIEIAANGGAALSLISKHYFGNIGGIILAITMIFACLKTAVGLITSCSETFAELFPRSLSYKTYTILFCAISFSIANIGLSNIISFSIPVLMFLYPLAITLILLSLFHRFFKGAPCIYQSVTVLTLFAAIFDFAKALPDGVKNALHLDAVLAFASHYLPFYDLGLGWIVPAVIGLIVGLIIQFYDTKIAGAASAHPEK
ncbi:branched-chain amino acid transport system ii carrier protein [Trichococcus palustris]|jgi:branched-chain amino acid:cation transporter, LIVCS family|uniref:Branched-chain amino acid transport system carrier protein n=1 Tax=Trichococcus palustris TaxID=140314 RepID=A0A143YBB1_9LACT|nr:branched-chain amino acid transport system II carrier protein [Trichococcus palustris]CZQ86583.1 branched-chain amino acid transport system ii carrier protein [Trichococcus palustris]SFK81079.1 branched-chain amino acid:cation transporter, LIVCS family [Trichococcus palustris]